FLKFALPRTVNAWAAQQAVGCPPHRIIRAPEKVAYIIAKSIVPLPPTVAREGADLIEPCRVPRLRNHLGTGQSRIRLDVPKYWGIRHYGTRRIARQDG